jgi:hypothetical protein
MEGEINMQLRAEGAGSPLVTSAIEWLAQRIRSLQEARMRGKEQSDISYHSFSDHCRAHNVSPMCEDDWKTHR